MQVFNSLNKAILITIFFVTGLHLQAQDISSFPTIITECNEGDYFPIVDNSKNTASIVYDMADDEAVIRAAHDLQKDISNVTGIQPATTTMLNKSNPQIIVGTVGKSRIIDDLVRRQMIDTKEIKGKWESVIITTSGSNESSGPITVMAGSDRRGTIYGIYELSRQLGVSPWYWWSDAPIRERETAYIIPGHYLSDEPKVKYRGIFINDEEPAFGGWARNKFGGINSDMYSHMFELLLRLKANYL